MILFCVYLQMVIDFYQVIYSPRRRIFYDASSQSCLFCSEIIARNTGAIWAHFTFFGKLLFSASLLMGNLQQVRSILKLLLVRLHYCYISQSCLQPQNFTRTLDLFILSVVLHVSIQLTVLSSYRPRTVCLSLSFMCLKMYIL